MYVILNRLKKFGMMCYRNSKVVLHLVYNRSCNAQM